MGYARELPGALRAHVLSRTPLVNCLDELHGWAVYRWLTWVNCLGGLHRRIT